MKAVIAELSDDSTALLTDMAARGLETIATNVRRPVQPPRAPLASKNAPTAAAPASASAGAGANASANASANEKNAPPAAESGGRGLPGGVPGTPATSAASYAEVARMGMRHLTQAKDSGFMKWLSSKASLETLDSWNDLLLQSLQAPEAREACMRRHFGPYTPPADMAGWLLSISVLAESLPLAFVFSDAQTAGFPLIYINNKFTDVTGYTKEDCYGRNCRFLQGPSTNPEHGKQLLDTLRAGQDSQIMLVNYRKSGHVFENLLTMAYVRDCHGRRRYCVGLQLDLSGLETDDGPWGQEALSSDAGRELIEETRKKYTKLIKLLPQTLPVPTPPAPLRNRDAPTAIDSAEWACPQLDRLAAALGVGERPCELGPNWAAALYALLDRASIAAIVTDMSVPGLPLDYANEAFATLTGWPLDEAVGRNCRFLQDESTEPLALYNLIAAVRTYSALSLQISNVRKDGSRFVNDLSLHPIFDADGACRFFVGILQEAGAALGEGAAALAALRASVPSKPVETALFPVVPPKFGELDVLDQWREVQKASTKLIRLLWATEPDGALRQVLCMNPVLAQQAIGSITDFFAKNNRTEDANLFAKLLEMKQAGTWVPLAGRKAIV